MDEPSHAPICGDDLPVLLELLNPSGLLNHLDRSRPYDGQPHQMHGVRGDTRLDRATLRDAYDAFVIGAFLASGLSPDNYPGSVHALPWERMDPLAVAQAACFVLEHRNGRTGWAGEPPSTCVFCHDEWPTLCPPHLHALGDQSPDR